MGMKVSYCFPLGPWRGVVAGTEGVPGQARCARAHVGLMRAAWARAGHALIGGGRGFWKAVPGKWEGIAERKRGRDLASGKASERARGRGSGVTCRRGQLAAGVPASGVCLWPQFWPDKDKVRS